VLLAGVGYLQWASQHHRPAVAARPAAAEPEVAAPQPRLQVDQPKSIPAQNPAEAPPTGKRPAVQTALATRENVNRKPVEAGLGSATESESARRSPAEPASPRSSEAPAGAEGGAPELRLAERYLEGKTGARDTTEAWKWLWKAVGKENSTAAVLLADLYARGDGVPKNCDQARILLLTAAKRGAPQASQALRNLETSSCR
jgi:TPR repeat protein